MSGKFLEMNFTSPAKVGREMLKRGLQIRANLESAVAETVLLAVNKIASDTPIDTGRLRASIAGVLTEEAGVDMTGPQVRDSEVAAGRRESGTYLNPYGMEGAVGTNVNYAPHVEFGHQVVVSSMGRKIKKRDAKTGRVRRVAGKAMFRKNIPIIREYFRKRCREAVKRGMQGQGIGGDS